MHNPSASLQEGQVRQFAEIIAVSMYFHGPDFPYLGSDMDETHELSPESV